jgi:hypothetical protein
MVAAIAMAFVLAIGSLHHAIILSLTMFAALIYGAPFGYGAWAAAAGWAALGNVIGGIGLVTALRLLQAGQKVVEERRASAGA